MLRNNRKMSLRTYSLEFSAVYCVTYYCSAAADNSTPELWCFSSVHHVQSYSACCSSVWRFRIVFWSLHLFLLNKTMVAVADHVFESGKKLVNLLLMKVWKYQGFISVIHITDKATYDFLQAKVNEHKQSQTMPLSLVSPSEIEFEIWIN